MATYEVTDTNGYSVTAETHGDAQYAARVLASEGHPAPFKVARDGRHYGLVSPDRNTGALTLRYIGGRMR